jgi:hypothetical protein
LRVERRKGEAWSVEAARWASTEEFPSGTVEGGQAMCAPGSYTACILRRDCLHTSRSCKPLSGKRFLITVNNGKKI